MSERALIAEGLLSKVAERLAVLGQVVRLRLVEQLADGSATPQELADALGLTQQNISKHLQILHRSGIVARQPEGANVIYSLKDESTVRLLEDVVASVAEHLRELSALAAGAPEDRASELAGERARKRADSGAYAGVTIGTWGNHLIGGCRRDVRSHCEISPWQRRFNAGRI